MYWFSIAAVILILAAAAYASAVWHTVQKSINASQPLIAAAVPYDQHPANPTMRILVAGDSLAAGVGAGTSTNSLAGLIGRDYPQADITNIAVSGSKLADLEKQLATTSSSYDILFITIGANDITGRTPAQDIEASLARVLAKSDTIAKKTVVLTAGDVGLSPAFLWPLSSYFDSRSRETRQIFIEQIAMHPAAAYVDLFNERKDEPFNTDVPRYYAPDHFHPSAAGYALWYLKLKPLL